MYVLCSVCMSVNCLYILFVYAIDVDIAICTLSTIVFYTIIDRIFINVYILFVWNMGLLC